MLLRGYKITKVLPCIVNPEWIRVWTELTDDVTEVIPYLNAVIKGAVYNPKAQSLTFRNERKLITIMPREINMGQVPDREDAIKTLDGLRDYINEIWEKHETITPLYERRDVRARDILDLLPKTNCRECGLPSCFAFAMALTKRQRHLKDCPALTKVEFAQNKDVLVRHFRSLGLDHLID